MKDNRSKIIVLFVVVYIIVIIGILWFIWFKPNDDTIVDLSRFTSYTEEQAASKLFNVYSQEIMPLFVLGYSDIIYDKMDEEFLQKNSLNNENFNEYLQDNGYLVPSVISQSYVTSKEGNIIIYTCKMSFNGVIKIINITERKPFDYKISFGNEVYGNNGYNVDVTRESNNMLFHIEETKKEVNRVTYKISITNKGTDNVKFRFDNATDVKIGVIGQGVYPISSFVSITGQNELTPGATIIRTYIYDIPMKFQNSNKYLIFYNVNINGQLEDISISI